MMKTLMTSGVYVAVVSCLLAGCQVPSAPFSNPFGGREPARVAPVNPQPPVVAAGRPSMAINASQQRVQDTIVARAKTRGTTVLGANTTGVTLEIPLRASSKIVQDQCGPHRDNRTLRVYLETQPNGPGTLVYEDRFVIDGGTSTCKLQLNQVDIDEANRSLADLKQQSEAPRTASAPRSADPPGRIESLNPGRPVVPVR
jgi:hypothetical protein